MKIPVPGYKIISITTLFFPNTVGFIVPTVGKPILLTPITPSNATLGTTVYGPSEISTRIGSTPTVKKIILAVTSITFITITSRTTFRAGDTCIGRFTSAFGTGQLVATVWLSSILAVLSDVSSGTIPMSF